MNHYHIGFIGSPWTVATYLIEGNSTKQFSYVNKMLNLDPNLLINILDMITKGSIDYVKQQIENGIDALMIFDTWGGLLSKENYENFSLSFIQKIILSTKKMDSCNLL